LLAALAFAVPSLANANGRFPRAERLVEDPRDANHLILAATYGLVTTADRGRSAYYVCEASFSGQDLYVGDPIVDLGSDGALIVDIQSGIHTSTDGTCTWSSAFGGPGVYVADFTVGKNQGPTLAIASATEDGSVGVHIAESSDGGRSFHLIGTTLPIGVAFTIDVAPSDANLVYVSALSKANVPMLAMSTDRGATWTTAKITTGPNELPYIAAIDPVDPRKIFVRTSSSDNESGVPTSNDALFVTTDGGASWREVFRASAEMLGFALSPDGSEVLIGYGDPMDADVLVDPTVLGIYRATTSDFAFARLSTASNTCLAWTQTGLYACASHLETGYAVAFAPAPANATAGVAGLAPLIRLSDVEGPACCAQGDVCATAWSAACVTFGACDAGAPVTHRCPADAGTGADASLIADASSAPDGGFVVTKNSSETGSCACRAGARSPRRGAHLTVPLVGLFAALARRRRRRDAR
jgi:MYXO-CTERM domain-containing protein